MQDTENNTINSNYGVHDCIPLITISIAPDALTCSVFYPVHSAQAFSNGIQSQDGKAHNTCSDSANIASTIFLVERTGQW